LSYIVKEVKKLTVKRIIKMGNPLLREVAEIFTKEEIVSDEVKMLVDDMWDTLESAGGIGLAAPQIGVSKQLAIIEISEDSERYPESEPSQSFIMFNPEITVLDDVLQGFFEGCLSVPGMRGYVERPRKIQVDYLDEEALPQTVVIEEFLATVFQHELDHLIGKLYVDRMTDISTLAFEDEMILQNKSEEDVEN
jgi:peptide deformylase